MRWKTIALWLDATLIVGIVAAELTQLIGILPTGLFDAAIIALSLAGLVPVVVNALRSLIKRQVSIDLLASVALVAALLAREWHSVAFITLMLASARSLSAYEQGQAERSIRSLLKLRPSTVRIKTDGHFREVPLGQVRTGDLVLVESGERVPVDGVVVSGNGAVDQSSLTGESAPINKATGNEVLSSTLNVGGSLVVRTTRIGEDTTFAKIVHLVQEAQHAKAPISTLANRFANWYILAMLVVALAIYGFTRDLSLVLAVLLVVCADDLAVGIPLALTAAIGAAAHRGVIVKGGAYLEGLAKAETLITDKTGTITEGKLEVQEVVPLGSATREKLLRLLGALEDASRHPTARAIAAYARAHDGAIPRVDDVHEEPGFGITGTVDGMRYAAGNEQFVRRDVDVSADDKAKIARAIDRGHSVTVLAGGGELLGFVALSDTVRTHAAAVIDDLRSLGIRRTVMLTGDNQRVAQHVAEEAHISEVHANLLPRDKMEFIRTARRSGKPVVMLGDGVNDAAALSIADVGIAMGGIGSDASIDSADVVLMRDNLLAVPRMVRLARYTMRVLRQDIGIWIATNAVGLVLVFAGILGPTGAAAYNFLTDIIPLANSLKLYRLHRRQTG